MLTHAPLLVLLRQFGEGLSRAVKQLPGGVDEALGSLLGILVLESLLRNFEAEGCILWDRKKKLTEWELPRSWIQSIPSGFGSIHGNICWGCGWSI